MKVFQRLLLIICFVVSLVILAGCNKKSEYLVEFDLQGANILIKSQKVNGKGKVEEPLPPIWEGYEFSGWYKDISFEDESIWIFSFDIVEEDITLYAKWEKVETIVEVNKSSKTFLKESIDEFTVYKFETNIPGPTIFILGGIHGDERAGWKTALEILDYNFKRGTVYVLPIASRRAVFSTPPKRYFETDLNRSFPGLASGTDTQRLAYYLYQAIKETKPDLVLDLHESRGSYTEGNLGDQIIVHDSLYNLYVDEVLYEFNNLELMEGKTKFRLDSVPPKGSINREFTEREGVPVFTLETNRGSKKGTISEESIMLETRIAEQKAMIEIIINNFQIIS